MSDSMSPTPARPVHSDPTRRRLAIGVLVAFVIGGLWIWGDDHPVQAFVAFEVPPTVRAADGGGIKRGELRRLRATVFDREGTEVARVDVTLEALTTPFTPAAALRLPAGDYLAQTILISKDGRFATLDAALKLEEDGAYVRAELKRPDRRAGASP